MEKSKHSYFITYEEQSLGERRGKCQGSTTTHQVMHAVLSLLAEQLSAWVALEQKSMK